MELDEINYYQYLLQNPRQYSIPSLGSYLHDFTQLRLQQHIENQESNISGETPTKLSGGDILFDDRVILCPVEIASSKLLASTSVTINNEITHLIGIVTCVYFHRDRQFFQSLDSWIYYPGVNGKHKLNRAVEIINNLLLANRQVDCQYLLMDLWYASQKFMATVDRADKIYYCPLKTNRLIHRSSEGEGYQTIGSLEWTDLEKEKGKIVKVKNFPKNKKIKLFRLQIAEQRLVYIATNDLSQSSVGDVMDIYVFRLHSDGRTNPP